MAYSEFTFASVRRLLAGVETETSLFQHVAELEPSSWLREALEKGRPFAHFSEKARSESIVWPILLACRELVGGACSIYSGAHLDVDAELGLRGECDFILTRTPPYPIPLAPLMVVVEAKKNDIEEGIGQCTAQMLGAAKFNEVEKNPIAAVHGCVTTGDEWQFLRLKANMLGIDKDRYYLSDLNKLLGIFVTIVKGNGI